ncbi:sensor histidine kinase [Acetivibrio straminisolvens]|uniref:histidine kinase n=1 Tax=Acetivibrio straminisolvens JCM 21531 TaxID=1294263 RepID=W4VC66_9FIRM|nr:HAMP domain-containing sensor histidine kinase [Acetivibrio straminisolvens]GAE90990.1 histidine kinase sensor protein [Acetivibrio straminisolvens JCM 21531]
MDNWHNNAKEPEKRCRYMVLGSVFAVGLGSPDTFKRYMMDYYRLNFSTSTYNKICLLHSIISTIPQYLTPPVFVISVIEYSGVLLQKFKTVKTIIYTIVSFPWLTLFFIFPPSSFSYYYENSKVFWYTITYLGLVYMIIYILVLVVSLYRSENPQEKKQKFLMCLFSIPSTTAAYIVCYVNKNIFKSMHGITLWTAVVLFFLSVFFFLVIKYNFMGVKIAVESYDYSLKKISEGTEILIHALNREMAKVKTSALLISEYCELPDDAQKNIDIMNSSINHICEIIHKVNNSLQTFHLDKSLYPLSELVVEAVNSIENSAKQSNIEIVFNQEDDAVVLCDKTLIVEVLQNVLNNSIEAIANNGRIEVSLSKHNSFASVAIKDNGPGIPKKIIPRIFDFYFSTKTHQSNYGLGLYFCKKVMLLHKGDISIKSVEGKGTTVFLNFMTKSQII